MNSLTLQTVAHNEFPHPIILQAARTRHAPAIYRVLEFGMSSLRLWLTMISFTLWTVTHDEFSHPMILLGSTDTSRHAPATLGCQNLSMSDLYTLGCQHSDTLF